MCFNKVFFANIIYKHIICGILFSILPLKKEKHSL